MKRITKTIGLVGLAAGVALSGAGVASADGSDEILFSSLAAVDMYIVGEHDQSLAITKAHAVCGALDHGMTRDTVAGTIYGASDDWTLIQAMSFVAASMSAYCPEYIPEEGLSPTPGAPDPDPAPPKRNYAV